MMTSPSATSFFYAYSASFEAQRDKAGLAGGGLAGHLHAYPQALSPPTASPNAVGYATGTTRGSAASPSTVPLAAETPELRPQLYHVGPLPPRDA